MAKAIGSVPGIAPPPPNMAAVVTGLTFAFPHRSGQIFLPLVTASGPRGPGLHVLGISCSLLDEAGAWGQRASPTHAVLPGDQGAQ